MKEPIQHVVDFHCQRSIYWCPECGENAIIMRLYSLRWVCMACPYERVADERLIVISASEVAAQKLIDRVRRTRVYQGALNLARRYLEKKEGH